MNPNPEAIKNTITSTITRGGVHLVIYALALTMLFPFLWMVSTSLKPETEVFTWPPRLLPWPPRWANYSDAWRIAPFGRYFFNTAFVAISVTA